MSESITIIGGYDGASIEVGGGSFANEFWWNLDPSGESIPFAVTYVVIPDVVTDAEREYAAELERGLHIVLAN